MLYLQNGNFLEKNGWQTLINHDKSNINRYKPWDWRLSFTIASRPNSSFQGGHGAGSTIVPEASAVSRGTGWKTIAFNTEMVILPWMIYCYETNGCRSTNQRRESDLDDNWFWFFQGTNTDKKKDKVNGDVDDMTSCVMCFRYAHSVFAIMKWCG